MSNFWLWLLAFLIIGALALVKMRAGRDQPRRSQLPEPVDLAGTGQAEKQDTWEGSYWEAAQPRACAARLRLVYRSGDGSISRREVTVRGVDATSDEGLMLGHCHLRDATRTFRMDRVEEAVDLDSGEIVTNLRSHLLGREPMGDRSMRLLLDQHFDVMRVLLFVGKADGQLRQAEKTVIAELAQQLTGDANIAADDISAVLNSAGVPTLQAFKLAVGRITDTTLRQQVLEATRRVIGTQKSVAPAEQEALTYMEKRFASPP